MREPYGSHPAEAELAHQAVARRNDDSRDSFNHGPDRSAFTYVRPLLRGLAISSLSRTSASMYETQLSIDSSCPALYARRQELGGFISQAIRADLRSRRLRTFSRRGSRREHPFLGLSMRTDAVRSGGDGGDFSDTRTGAI